MDAFISPQTHCELAWRANTQFQQYVRQGKIVYARLFSEPADALEAAGLRE